MKSIYLRNKSCIVKYEEINKTVEILQDLMFLMVLKRNIGKQKNLLIVRN